MNQKEWHYDTEYCDKSNWKAPEYCEGEPDKVQWVSDVTGLPCLAVRHPSSGHWCGYAAVMPGHKWHGKDYNDVHADLGWEHELEELSFSRFCADSKDPSKHICHIPEPGEPDNVWWLGFDFAHSCHLTPAHDFHYDQYARYVRLTEVQRSAEAWSLVIKEHA